MSKVKLGNAFSKLNVELDLFAFENLEKHFLNLLKESEKLFLDQFLSISKKILEEPEKNLKTSFDTKEEKTEKKPFLNTPLTIKEVEKVSKVLSDQNLLTKEDFLDSLKAFAKSYEKEKESKVENVFWNKNPIEEKQNFLKQFFTYTHQKNYKENFLSINEIENKVFSKENHQKTFIENNFYKEKEKLYEKTFIEKNSLKEPNLYFEKLFKSIEEEKALLKLLFEKTAPSNATDALKKILWKLESLENKQLSQAPIYKVNTDDL